MHWPEPMLIDLVGDVYRGRPLVDRIFAARLQVRFLEQLVEGNLRQAAFLRLELIAACASRGIAVDQIEVADQAAFDELIRTAETRFRNSPKAKHQILLRLNDARLRLPSKTETASMPARGSANVRALDPARTGAMRSFSKTLRKVAANG